MFLEGLYFFNFSTAFQLNLGFRWSRFFSKSFETDTQSVIVDYTVVAYSAFGGA